MGSNERDEHDAEVRTPLSEAMTEPVKAPAEQAVPAAS